MIDVWQHVTDGLVSLKDKVTFRTDDHLYYEIHTNDAKKKIIGTVNKTYANHARTVIVQLRENTWHFSATDTEQEIEVNVAKMKNEILNSALILEIENI